MTQLKEAKTTFLFYLDDEESSGHTSQVAALVNDLAAMREWTLGAPVFVDHTEDSGGGKTVGGVLELLSALPPNSIDRETDAAHLAEIETIVDAVRDFSERSGTNFDFELGGTYVGSVTSGVLSRTLELGLLNPWRAHLGVG